MTDPKINPLASFMAGTNDKEEEVMHPAPKNEVPEQVDLPDAGGIPGEIEAEGKIFGKKVYRDPDTGEITVLEDLGEMYAADITLPAGSSVAEALKTWADSFAQGREDMRNHQKEREA